MKRALLSLALLITVAAPRLFSRTIPTYTYDQLLAQSDFVVVARPLQKTHDTPERSTLRDVSPPVPVIGVETQFETTWVLKGSKRDRFILHHYRERQLPPKHPSIETVVLDGLLLVKFDPKGYSEYLLFLVRERDGRFAPAGGQTDVDTVSVWRLSPVTR